ncbi:hypothetical protein E0H26_21285 [Micromonospora zingiberis]|uniref:Uncharacterized protein n=1 Tax=Micromonospora zingiberis TaxID=2053011 RepID=A0A4R0GE83_9ACTN|nr:hypothetical protein [Micromonospora zingiberis]TCB94453.1 hypothetical protein E0H26_21285 [Micromonospora zingiberis]
MRRRNQRAAGVGVRSSAHDPVGGQAMPKLAEDQQKLVEEIWYFLVDMDRWPTFAELDRRMYRDHGIAETDAILVRLPAGLVSGYSARSPASLDDATEIFLTVAGICATGSGRRELNLFLAVVRHAAVLEREFLPPEGCPNARPQLTSPAVAQHLNLDAPSGESLLTRIGAILRAEDWGWASASASGGIWTFEVDRRVRQLAGVQGVDDYCRRRVSSSSGLESSTGTQAWNQRSSDLATRPRGFVSGLEVLTVVLTATGVGIAGLQVNWQPVGVISLIAAIMFAVLSWHRWRSRRRATDPILIGSTSAGLLLLLVFFSALNQ